MPNFSWKKVKELGISETEKDRFCAIFLTNIDQFKPTAAQLNAAADEFGASQAGFRVMYGNITKKYKDNNLYLDGEGGGATPADGEGGETEAAVPSAAKPKTPRKRKTPAGEGEPDGSVKKRGRPNKKAQAEAAAAATAAEAVKEEFKGTGGEETSEMGAMKAEATVEA